MRVLKIDDDRMSDLIDRVGKALADDEGDSYDHPATRRRWREKATIAVQEFIERTEE